jgi:hypothetical protein
LLLDVALEQEEYEADNPEQMTELDAIRDREKGHPERRTPKPSKPLPDGTGVWMKASDIPVGGILLRPDCEASSSSAIPLHLASGVAKGKATPTRDILGQGGSPASATKAMEVTPPPEETPEEGLRRRPSKR